MDEKRLVLYRKRIAIQRDEKANNDALNKAKKINSSKADTLVGIIQPVESQLAAKLKAIDDAIELEKQKELNRVNGHRNVINSFGPKLIEVMKIEDISVLEEKRTACQNWFRDYKAEEFQEELEGVVNSYIDTINGLVKILISKKVEEPKPELYANAAPEKETDMVDFGNETPYVSNIPQDLRAANESKLSEVGRMSRGLQMTFVPDEPNSRGILSEAKVAVKSENGKIESMAIQTLEERAKSGEFMTQVAANLVYGGYRFYIDTTLNNESLAKIKTFIQEVVDSENANEEAF